MKIPTIPSVATLVLCLVSVTSPVQAFLSPNLNLRNTQTVPIGQPRSRKGHGTYAEVTAGQRRLISQKNQYDAVADDWYRRAQLALKSNKENLAREALARREQAYQKATSVQQQIDSQASNLDKLYEGMNILEGKIREAQTKKSDLATRAKTAKSTVWVNDMLSGLSGKTSMDAFRRMEDKVAALEASAEVSAEMLNNSLMSFNEDKNSNKVDMEMEFRRLETSDAVDREFQKLKAKMLPAGGESIRIPITSIDRIDVNMLQDRK